MRESSDIRRLLKSWPYNPDQEARIIAGDNGREILQVRTPLGIEQLEMEGRPDGERPHDMDSALEYYLERFAEAGRTGSEGDFELNEEACSELFAEGTLYYFRYVRLFQLKRWAETVRDTARNLRAFDFIHRHAAREEDRNNLEKWRPYVIRMNAIASAFLTLDQGDHSKATAILQAAITQIEGLEELDEETFVFERTRSLGALREVASQIEQSRPLSALEQLEKQLRRAIDQQQFERAAELRDRIRMLKSQ